MTTTDLRPIRESDIPALDVLLRTAYKSDNDYLLRLQLAVGNARIATVVADGGDGPVGMGALYDYGTLGYVAMMATAPEAQRSGIGRRVLTHLIARSDRLGHRAIALEATAAGAALYAQYGFVPLATTVGYEGASASTTVAPFVRRATPDDAEAIGAYDLAAFGGDRRASVQAWLADPSFELFVAGDGERIVGYGAIHGKRVGPLLADHLDAAAALFDALRGSRSFAAARMSVPGDNDTAQALVASRGWTKVSEHAHMARGDAFYFPRRKMYGLTSLGEG